MWLNKVQHGFGRQTGELQWSIDPLNPMVIGNTGTERSSTPHELIGGILNNSHKDINELWTQATPCGSPQWFKVKPDRAQRTISQNMKMCY
jgi:hypothetical protein